ncbi:hypothetical protein GGX14DRAFT_395932 [Mycena pura]|uniref:Novel STAND NTPase 1 domain-containing protein n=1 Tax=Mycena pura TaxID=153505 RepID=A0AAD6VFF0_9AGAR|nr:hypothetical protein GGX14DRAFT_395932 [Mycena pura]
MPSLPNATQIRLNSITACLKAAVDTVNTLANNLGFSFFNPISATIGYSGDLEPKTLHKIHTFVEAQQDGNKIKILLRRSEMNTLFKDCKIGLQHAFDVFKVNAANLFKDMNEMQRNAMERHQEVLDLIASLSDTTNSETMSSLSRVLSSSFNSSTSLSMLPSMPQIFHGRESELSDIIKLFTRGAPHIAILGAGGMGKTSLARAVLHHPDISHKYGECRIFVVCDVASTMQELVVLIVNYLGLKLGRNPTQQIIHHLESRPPTLLILDNLETPWESSGSRKEIEEFLALLTDVQHLAVIGKLGFPKTYGGLKVNFDLFSYGLLGRRMVLNLNFPLTSAQITMRGAERPAQVRWTRPFLEPLSPLAYDAAQKTFIDIAGEIHDSNDVDKILHLTDNMPLAIDLMAHLADSEGCATVLSRWDTEKTSLVSDGYDRRSNLDMSIALSLSSPRMASVSGSKDLLSLLSMLPDGMSDQELRKSNLPIHNILECKATLLRTSLAHSTSQKRLKVLVPIQEHMQRHHPVQLLIVEPLFQYYRELLELYNKHQGTMLAEIIPQITMNFVNIQSLLSFRLQQEQLDHRPRTVIPLMDLVAASLPTPVDHGLEVHFLSELFYNLRENSRTLIDQALAHFPYFNDSQVKCRFYSAVALHYRFQDDLTLAEEFCKKALHLSVSTGKTGEQSSALSGLAYVKWQLGDYVIGKALARESQKVAQLTADLYCEADALLIEASCLADLGGYPKAIAQYKRAQSLLALCDMAGGTLAQQTMNHMGDIYSSKSEYIRARDIHTRLLSCAVEHTYEVAISCLNLAEIDISLDRPIQNVQRNIDTAWSIFKKLGYSIGSMWCDMFQANLYLRERNMSAAHKDLKRVLQLTWAKSNEVTTYCLEKLGDTKRWSSIYWTYTWPTVLLVHALKTKHKLWIYKALQFLGDFSLVEGDHNTAISLFTIALNAFTYMDIHCSRAECMLQLGDISKTNGDFGKAEELWKLARPLFECSSQGKSIALVDEKLLSIPSIHTDVHKLQLLTVGLLKDEDGLMDHNSATGKEVEDLAIPIQVTS